MKCQLTNSLRALSGTSTLSSNLRATQLEICMILFSSRNPFIAKNSHKDMIKKFKKYMRKGAMDL